MIIDDVCMDVYMFIDDVWMDVCMSVVCLIYARSVYMCATLKGKCKLNDDIERARKIQKG